MQERRKVKHVEVFVDTKKTKTKTKGKYIELFSMKEKENHDERGSSEGYADTSTIRCSNDTQHTSRKKEEK